DEIGKVYGVTRERIRQIEPKTMSKLRHPSRSQVLRDYLDYVTFREGHGPARAVPFPLPSGEQDVEPAAGERDPVAQVLQGLDQPVRGLGGQAAVRQPPGDLAAGDLGPVADDLAALEHPYGYAAGARPPGGR